MASAQAPDSISFQGLLTNPVGTPLNGAEVMKFKLYKNGTAVWTETHPTVTVTDGVFNVLLGSVNPLDTVAFNQPIELGITLGSEPEDPEIVPRTPLAAAPFALGMRGVHAEWSDDGFNKSFNILGGGSNNSVGAGVAGATISGGGGVASPGVPAPNMVMHDFGTIGGGFGNTVSGMRGTIGGGENNSVSATSATVGGGASNTASDAKTTVGGGEGNTAGEIFATVGGGHNNTATGTNSTIGGGSENTANGDYATVGGGDHNTSSGNRATIGGGFENVAHETYATVAGGDRNMATGAAAMVAGGQRNRAHGSHSFAAGYRARANHEGAFVWNDRSMLGINDTLASTAENQFIIRAAGGVGIGTNSPKPGLTISRQSQAAAHQLELRNVGNITGGNFDGIAFTQTATGATELASIKVLYHNDGRPDLSFSVRDVPDALFIESETGDVGVGTTSPSQELHVNGDITAVSVTETSDARFKRNVNPLTGAMSKVRALQGVTFDWNEDEWPDQAFGSGSQIGLIAQDVEAVVPEVVEIGDDGFYSVAYAKLVPLLIEAIKEQQAIIELQEGRLVALEAEIAPFETGAGRSIVTERSSGCAPSN